MCEKCNDTGYIEYIDNEGYEYIKMCDCLKAEIRLARAKASGLGDMIDLYTFDNFIVENKWQKDFRDKAIKYVKEKNNYWFTVLGQSGCGKTHICTAICREFLLKGSKTVRFMSWVEDSTKIKQSIVDGKTYDELIDGYKNAEILYIDDFFKIEPTTADIKLAVDIINYRYLKSKSEGKCFKTIISSEKDILQLNKIDNAILGRIVELSNEYIAVIKGQEKNYRLKNIL